jgi:hypothetical protein
MMQWMMGTTYQALRDSEPSDKSSKSSKLPERLYQLAGRFSSQYQVLDEEAEEVDDDMIEEEAEEEDVSVPTQEALNQADARDAMVTRIHDLYDSMQDNSDLADFVVDDEEDQEGDDMSPDDYIDVFDLADLEPVARPCVLGKRRFEQVSKIDYRRL